MRKLNKSALFAVSVILAGSMAIMSGCGASGETAANNVEEQAVQRENSIPVEVKSADEETQGVVGETRTEAEAETQTEAETETQAEAETETQAEEKTETETAAVSQPEETSPAVQEAAAVAEGSVAESDYAVIVKGVTIPLNGDMRNYTALLGEPDAFSSAKSCTEAGDDKVYTYGGIVIYTYITNGADIISLIEIEGSESLIKGVRIGSTREEVIAAYGSSYIEDGSELLYEMGNKTLGIQMNGETVSFIEMFG